MYAWHGYLLYVGRFGVTAVQLRLACYHLLIPATIKLQSDRSNVFNQNYSFMNTKLLLIYKGLVIQYSPLPSVLIRLNQQRVRVL